MVLQKTNKQSLPAFNLSTIKQYNKRRHKRHPHHTHDTTINSDSVYPHSATPKDNYTYDHFKTKSRDDALMLTQVIKVGKL